jgi:hypothetical protein
LRVWAAETALEASGATGVRSGAWVVDPSLDGPPYAVDGPVDLPPRCAILAPPPGFIDLVRASQTAGQVASAQRESR